MRTLSRLARPALLAAVSLVAMLAGGCAQTDTGSGTSTMGGARTMPPDEPVGGRAVMRPVPPGQNLPGGDSADSAGH